MGEATLCAMEQQVLCGSHQYLEGCKVEMTAGSLKFANDLYARGFLFFRTGAFEAPEEFRISRIASWTLALHDSAHASVAQADEDFVAVIGYAMDLETEHDDQTRIANE